MKKPAESKTEPEIYKAWENDEHTVGLLEQIIQCNPGGLTQGEIYALKRAIRIIKGKR